tara:strand:+ start:585 stop:974 length:390 start_codon:yes stop_codon:yes gene_type:complete
MSIYKPTSWGRTRRPKAPHNVDKNTITGSTLLNLNQLAESEFTDANGCYRTENQRFAHIACSGSATEVTNLYAYNYASGFWHEVVTGSTNTSVVVGPNQHQIVDINGADWVALTSGSGIQVVTMAFSTF